MLKLLYQNNIDDIILPNCLPIWKRTKIPFNDVNVRYNNFESILEYLDIPFNYFLPKDIDDDVYLFVIQPNTIEKAFFFENIFYFIDDDIIDLIHRGFDIRILIWFPYEGFKVDMPFFMDSIHKSLLLRNIPFENCYLIFGDMKINKNYYNWLKKYDIQNNINCLGIDIFETNYLNEIKNLNSNYFRSEDDLYNNLNKNYIFLNKNANPREHRVVLNYDLYKRDILRYGINSFIKRYFEPSFPDASKWYNINSKNQKKEIEHNGNYWLENNTPIILDFDKNSIEYDLNERITKLEHFNDTYFSLVNETIVENDNEPLFLTEKVYMTIMNYHPFLIFGSNDILAYLKSKGYYTFPELFDESYDNIKDIIKRKNKILKNVEDVCSMNKKKLIEIHKDIIPKLIENKKTFLNQKRRKNLLQVLSRVLE